MTVTIDNSGKLSFTNSGQPIQKTIYMFVPVEISTYWGMVKYSIPVEINPSSYVGE